MHPSLDQVDHRPWPLPSRRWIWQRSWLDLAFLHFRVDPAQLAGLIPAGLEVERWDGSAWVGIVPFRMAGVTRRPLPVLPFFRSFPELNVRTYVTCRGMSGVWFFSLDTTSWPFVLGGRMLYGLPYFAARMRHVFHEEWHHYSSLRRGGKVRFIARYRPAGELFIPARHSFERWVSERYCLYSFSARRGLERVEVHHAPWPLHPAEAMVEESNLLAAAGITSSDEPPVCHFSPGVHVVSYSGQLVVSEESYPKNPQHRGTGF